MSTPIKPTVSRAVLLLLLLTAPLAGLAAPGKGPAAPPLSPERDLTSIAPIKTRATSMVGLGVKTSDQLYEQLTTDDQRNDDGVYYDTYTFQSEAGTEIHIDMTSEDFDTYLELYYHLGDGYDLVASNDDYGETRNSAVRLTAERSGEYLIVARSYGAGATGAYLLRLTETPPYDSPPVVASSDGVVGMNESVNGVLDPSDPLDQEGRLFDLYTFHGTENQYVNINLVSDEFDTILAMFTGTLDAPEHYYANDDRNMGDDTNSQLYGPLPVTATYTLMVKAYSGMGAYTLSVTDARAEADGPVVHDWPELYPGGGDEDGRYALLVGINDYPGTSNDLDGCVGDTRVMRTLLVRRFGFDPENIVVLTDAEANREHILNAFTRHLGQAGRDGVAVFYYSGHGVQLDGNYGLAAEFDKEEDGLDEALAIWSVDEAKTMILDDELGMLADGLAAERVLVMLDACHSGTGTRAKGEKQIRNFAEVKDDFTIPETFVGLDKSGAPTSPYKGGELGELVVRRQNHVLLSAAASDETALEGRDWPDYGGVGGVFTYHLVRAIDAAEADATFADIGRRVRDDALNYTTTHMDHVQTAQYEGDLLDMPIREFLEPR